VKEALTYNDVLLVPQYSNIRSRSEVSLRNNLGFLWLDLPIISAPMDTVTEENMAYAIAEEGGLGIIHRYNSICEQVSIARNVLKTSDGQVGAAVGVTGDYLQRAIELVDEGVKVICVDVAHGHHISAKEAIIALRKAVGHDVHIMAGNVATKAGFDYLAEAGADSIRVGIGGGSICSTRIKTGHGLPNIYSITECASSEWAGDVNIIADGGIRTSGDIVKALAAGADFVMLGSILAGTSQAPGEILNIKDGKFKSYRGMASKDAQMDWRGRASSLEGVATTIKYKGDVLPILNDLRGGIASGLSYSGARTIAELQNRAKFVRQTQSGQMESDTHILYT